MVQSPGQVLSLLRWFFRFAGEEGWTQDEMADSLGVGQSTISRWENGLSNAAELELRSGTLAKLRALREDRTGEVYIQADPVRRLVHDCLKREALPSSGSGTPSLRDRLAYAQSFAIRAGLSVADLSRLDRIRNNLLSEAEAAHDDAQQNSEARPEAP